MFSVCALAMVVAMSTALPSMPATALPSMPATVLPSMPATVRLSVRSGYNQQRVYNGFDDSASKYPFVVALLLVNLRTCTGTLITPTWVLTAAHCKKVTNIQYGNMTVSPKDILSQSKLLKMIPHQNYQRILMPGEGHCDIALILVEDVRLKVFGKLSGVDYHAISGSQVEYAGFGKTGKKSGYSGIMEDFMRPLQLADGMVVSCTAVYKLATPCMCVVPRCSLNQSVLPGDSGGPLFYDGKVVGVAHSLQKAPVISLFVPVSPFLTWIQQVMTKEEQNPK